MRTRISLLPKIFESALPICFVCNTRTNNALGAANKTREMKFHDEKKSEKIRFFLLLVFSFAVHNRARAESFNQSNASSSRTEELHASAKQTRNKREGEKKGKKKKRKKKKTVEKKERFFLLTITQTRLAAMCGARAPPACLVLTDKKSNFLVSVVPLAIPEKFCEGWRRARPRASSTR